MFEYTANVTEVYDGDTITVDIDLGLGVWVRGEKLRLLDINAPEVRGEQREAGLVSRDWLRKLILGRTVRIRTQKDKKGKYGRYLADVFPSGGTATVSELSVLAGMSVRAEY